MKKTVLRQTAAAACFLLPALALPALADVTVNFPGPQNLGAAGGFAMASPQMSGTITGVIFHFQYSNSANDSRASHMAATINGFQWGYLDTYVNGASFTAAGSTGAPNSGNDVNFTSGTLAGVGALHLVNQSVTIGYGNSFDGGSCTMSNVSITLVGVNIGPPPFSPTVTTGTSTPGSGAPGTPRLLKVNVIEGGNPSSPIATVRSNLTTIGGPAQADFHDDGLNGDVTAGDHIYSYSLAAVTAGGTVSVKATDELGRFGSGNIIVSVITPPHPNLGPDVVTYELTEMARWGTNTTISNGNPVGSITAYSVGTTSSNLGDYPVLWVEGDPSYLPDFDSTQQPCISQNMYRLKSYGAYTRFEQIGQSWLKHGFVSTNSGGGPGTCISNTQVWRPSLQNYQNFNGNALGINCTDTYGSSLNGGQGNLGPKNIVNATTGFSPHTQGGGNGDGTVSERLQVPTVDVTGQPAGTRFYVDAYYVTQDDSQFVKPGMTVATNALNNASWREITASTINAAPPNSPTFSNTTQRYNPGIFAWKIADAAVTQVNADHDDYPNPGTGFKDSDGNPQFLGTTIRSRYIVSVKTTSLGGGLYRYEYAVYNHNSDRSANRFTVSMPAGAVVTDTSFHAPQWHSGEPYSNAAWTTTRSTTSFTFKTQDFSTNPNANALRWGNMFNFGFTCDVAPASGTAILTLFKAGVPGAPGAVNAEALPTPAMPLFCGAADIGKQGGLAGPDNALDNNDFVVYLNFFFASDSRADCGIQGGVSGQDGLFDNNDFVVFLDQFFTGCP